MMFLMAFLTCGLICVVAQLLMAALKLKPPVVLNLFLAAGGLLTPCGFMAWLDAVGGGGSLVAIDAAGNAFEQAGTLVAAGEPVMLLVICGLFFVSTVLGMVAGEIRFRCERARGELDGAGADATVAAGEEPDRARS